ncbi:MAG: type II secretion system F family protein [Polyangiales bacterium]
MSLSRIMSVGAALLICGAIATVIVVFGSVKPLERPHLGIRGTKRRAALAQGGLFTTFEHAIRVVGAWFAELPLDRLRTQIDRKLVMSGEYLGLSANDFIGLSFLSSVAFTGVGLILSNWANLPLVGVVAIAILGLFLPWLQVNGIAKERLKSIDRSLPVAIDLSALCMGAGLDFPGTLRQVVSKASSRDSALVEEFGRILQELELGYTRKKALENFGDRAPSVAVREFVNRVVQTEEKGTPLAEVLRIQATSLRQKRSIAAEENAAKAGIMMMGPLMCIMVSILLLLIGPFMADMASGGMGFG